MPTSNPAEYTPNWNDPIETRWFDDPDEVVAFARWFWDGKTTGVVREVLAMFETPWKWEASYNVYLEDKNG